MVPDVTDCSRVTRRYSIQVLNVFRQPTVAEEESSNDLLNFTIHCFRSHKVPHSVMDNTGKIKISLKRKF